jgi:hypothetical protein
MEWPIGYGYSRGYTDRITLRYSISERDAYDHGGCIEVYGGVANTYIYNNVVYYIPERNAGADVAEGEGGCLTTDKWGKSGVPDIQVYNNIFVADKSQSQNPNAVGYLVRHASGTITANNNLYWTIGTMPLYYVSRKTGDFAWWQSKGYDANGLNANPQFAGPFGGGDAAYALQALTPCPPLPGARERGRLTAIERAARAWGEGSAARRGPVATLPIPRLTPPLRRAILPSCRLSVAGCRLPRLPHCSLR